MAGSTGSMIVCQRFSKNYRLRNTAQFQRVFAVRRSAADQAVILFAAPNELPHCRLGLSVSRKVGNAVVRNRWKRLLREAFRLSLSELPKGFDIVVVPQRNADVRTVKHLEQSLIKLTAKIVNRTPRKTQTVLLTRPAHQVEPAKTELEILGFQVLLQPAIDILPPEDWTETDEAVQQVLQGEFDGLIFSSSNGVQSFFDRLEKTAEHRAGFLAGFVKIAVAGSGTDSALYQRIGRHADVVPETFTAEGVAKALTAEAKQGRRFLHVRTSRGRDVLKRLLTEAGGRVTEIAVYRSVDRTEPDTKIAEFMQRGGIDFVTVTSSAIARSLVNMFGELLRQTSLVSISPVTSKTLRDLGFPPQREAAEASLTGIINTLNSSEGGGTEAT